MNKRSFHFYLMLITLVIFIYIATALLQFLAGLSILQWFMILIVATMFAMIIKWKKKHNKIKKAEERRLELERQGNLQALMKMNGYIFEQYICDLFNEIGFNASLTKRSGDGGKDILIYRSNFFAVAECKRYAQKNKISRPDIQKFHSAMIDSQAEKGYFVTTGEFTIHAENYVLDKPITLINGNQLVQLVQDVTIKEFELGCPIDYLSNHGLTP